jgi:hypothetical protein
MADNESGYPLFFHLIDCIDQSSLDTGCREHQRLFAEMSLPCLELGKIERGIEMA